VYELFDPFGRKSKPMRDSIIELFPLVGGPTKIIFGRDIE